MIRPFIGVILAPENVPVLRKALQSPPGVASVDGKPIRKRVLSGYTVLLAKKRQQSRFRMIKPQGGKASLGDLVPASGKLADQIEKRQKAAR